MANRRVFVGQIAPRGAVAAAATLPATIAAATPPRLDPFRSTASPDDALQRLMEGNARIVGGVFDLGTGVVTSVDI